MVRKVLSLMLAVFCVSGSLVSNAQSPYKISGRITGLQDTVIYLANYYGNKLYYNDTSLVDAKGNYSFPGKPYKEGGKYALVLPGSKVIEFIVG